MKSAAVSIVWLGTGIVLAGGLYWGFLSTPESNVTTLALSAVLVVAVLAVVGAAVNGTALAALEDRFARDTVRRAVRALPLFVAALPPALLAIWLAARGLAWLDAHDGEISAWFIATFGWPDVRWLIDGARWAVAWLAWIVGPVLSVSLLAWLLSPQDSGGPLRWAVRVWHWRVLGLATLWFVLLVALPWQATAWRPPGMPTGGTMEPVLAAAKLACIGLLMTTGAALMIRAAARGPRREPRS